MKNSSNAPKHFYHDISHLTRLAVDKLIKKTNKYCRWCGLMDSPD